MRFLPPAHFSFLAAFLFLLLLAKARAEGDETGSVLLDLNFYDPGLSMADADPAGATAGRTTGSLPQDWHDDSAWASLRVDYRIAQEDAQRYLAIRTSEIEKGNASVRYPLPDYPDGSLFQLKIKARGNVPVQFGIRDASRPWDYVWSQRETLGTGWKEFEYLFTLDHNKQPMGFWWEVKGAGEADIASIHLERVSQAKLVAELHERYPGNGPSNVLRTTRLPLGLQSGWAIDLPRFGNSGFNPAEPMADRDPVVAADAQTPGVSGFPALHLVSNGKIGIWSEPFSIPLPFQKYTASFYVKGTGKGQLVVVRDGATIIKRDFQAGPAWSRIELPFDSRLGAKFYALRVDFYGEIWVDAWQVGPGEKAGPYVTQFPTEISLACVAKETALEHIQFSDEPAQVHYCVTASPAPPAGLQLHARVVDLYGESKELPPVALQAQATNEGQFDFTAFPQHPLGAFRIETWVADAGGKQASPYQEIIIHRMHRPRYWGKDAPDSPFGTHVGGDLPHITMAKAIGMNWTRSHDAGVDWAGWYFLEKQPGQWTFSDEEVGRYRQLHLKIMATLVTTPLWASDMVKPHNTYFDTFYQPKDPAQYANYVRAFATHYKGVIDAYDIWNEPWNAAWFASSFDETKKDRMGYQPSKDSPADYANLVKIADTELKKVDPAITVVGVNTTTTTDYTKPTPDITGRDWSLLQSGLKSDENCDVLCFHDYDSSFQGSPGDTVAQGYQVAMGPFLQRGITKPVWMTEGSSLVGYTASGFYHYTLPYTDAENVIDTGNRACRFALSLLGNHVDKFFFYSMAHYQYFGKAATDPYENMVTEEGALHPSADAFSAMAWRLEDTKFVKCVPLGSNTYAYLFSGKGRAIAVLAPPADGATITLPTQSDWEVTDLLGNPVTEAKAPPKNLTYIETSQSVDQLEQAVTKLAVGAP